MLMATQSTKNNLVSVITATYNREKYLPLAVETVLSQTHTNLDYHIVDDGSHDNTLSVLKPYLKDKRVHYYYQENKGQATARNVGLKNSTGQYICFLDSDNVWEAGKLDHQLELLSHKQDVDVVYGDVSFIDEEGVEILMPQMKRYSGQITEMLLRDNFVTFNTAMFRRKCFVEMGGLDESLGQSDDYEWWLRLSTQYNFYYHPKLTARYRISNKQLSADKEKRFAAIEVILRRFFEAHPNLAAKDVQNSAWSHFYVRRGRSRALRARYYNALQDYVKALSFGRLRAGPWRALCRMLILWS